MQRVVRWHRAAWIVSLLVSLLLSGIAAHNRKPWSDEGEFSSAAYNLAHHGFMGTTVLESAGTGLTRIDRHTYWIMPLFPLGQAVWYTFAPSTVFWTRIYTLLWVPVAIAALYGLLKCLFPRSNVPTLASCLYALSYILMDNAGFARPDVMCCALGIAGLASFLYLRQQRFGWSLATSNAFIAASGLTHPNGIFHLIGLWTLILLFDRNRITTRMLAYAVMPYVLFAAGWGIYIAQDPKAFIDQMRANSSFGRWPTSPNPFLILWAELRDRYFPVFGLVTRGFALLKTFSLAAYLGGIVVILFNRGLRRQKSVRLLLILTAVYFLSMCIFNQKLSYYMVHIVPFYVSLLAISITWLWDCLPRFRPVIAVVVLLLVSVDTGGLVMRAATRSYIRAERAALDFVRQHSRPDDRIIGSSALIYGMKFDPRLKDDPYLGLRSGTPPNMIVVEELYTIQFNAWSKERPRDMAQIRACLAQYQNAYHAEGYDVYLPRAGMQVAQGSAMPPFGETRAP